jgi:hypothetical protein
MENTKNLNNKFTNIKDKIINDLKNENENNKFTIIKLEEDIENNENA